MFNTILRFRTLLITNPAKRDQDYKSCKSNKIKQNGNLKRNSRE